VICIVLLLEFLTSVTNETDFCYSTDPDRYMKFGTRTLYEFAYDPLRDLNEDIPGILHSQLGTNENRGTPPKGPVCLDIFMRIPVILK